MGSRLILFTDVETEQRDELSPGVMVVAGSVGLGLGIVAGIALSDYLESANVPFEPNGSILDELSAQFKDHPIRGIALATALSVMPELKAKMSKELKPEDISPMVPTTADAAIDRLEEAGIELSRNVEKTYRKRWAQRVEKEAKKRKKEDKEGKPEEEPGKSQDSETTPGK